MRATRVGPGLGCRGAGGNKPCGRLRMPSHRSRRSCRSEDTPVSGRRGRLPGRRHVGNCSHCRDCIVIKHRAMAADPGKLAEPAGILKTSGARGPGAGSSLLPSRGYLLNRPCAVAMRRSHGLRDADILTSEATSAGAAGGGVVILVDCAARDGVPAAGRTGDLDPAGLYLR